METAVTTSAVFSMLPNADFVTSSPGDGMHKAATAATARKLFLAAMVLRQICLGKG